MKCCKEVVEGEDGEEVIRFGYWYYFQRIIYGGIGYNINFKGFRNKREVMEESWLSRVRRYMYSYEGKKRERCLGGKRVYVQI